MSNDFSADSRFERICLYVDDEMSSADRKRFEQDMSTDPVLRAEIAELIRIKTAVSTLPEIDPPRNFLLNPADYQKPVVAPVEPEPQKSGFPSWILAGLLGALMVSFLFIFMNIGGLGGANEVADSSINIESASDASVAPAQVAEVVEEVMEEVMETEAEPLILPSPEAEKVEANREAEVIEEAAEESVDFAEEAMDEVMADDALAEAELQSAAPAMADDSAGEAAAAEVVQEAPPPLSATLLPQPTPAQQSAPYPEPTAQPPTNFLSGFPANGKTLCDSQTQIDLLDSLERRIFFGTLDTCQPVIVLDYVWLGEIGIGLYQVEVPAGSVIHISDDEAIALDLPMIGWVEAQFIEEN